MAPLAIAHTIAEPRAKVCNEWPWVATTVKASSVSPNDLCSRPAPPPHYNNYYSKVC
jgi:hypothetical protein